MGIPLRQRGVVYSNIGDFAAPGAEATATAGARLMRDPHEFPNQRTWMTLLGRQEHAWCTCPEQNTAAGERYLWPMNGTTRVDAVSLGSASTDWKIVS